MTRIISYNLTRTAAPTEILPIAGFKVDAKCEGANLRVVLTRSSGAVIRPDDKLTVVTSDFIAGGGDGLMAPAGPVGDVRNPEGAPILRESVVAWLRSRGGRLNENQFVSPDNRRWHYPMPRPVTCR